MAAPFNHADAIEVGGPGDASWTAPAESRSSTHGEHTVSIGALTLEPAPFGRKGSQERRKSIDTKSAAAAGAAAAAESAGRGAGSEKKSVGWEPVSPGLVDQSPEVKASQKPGNYYGMQWPGEEAGAGGAAAAAASAGDGSVPPNLHRRNSKAAELGFAVAGLDGNLSQLTGRQFKELLKAALQQSDLATARRLLTAPLPKSVGVVQMFLKRHKHGFFSKLYPSYECFLEEPNRPFFLMAAKKRTKNKTSNYTISLLSMDALEKSNSEAAHTAEDPNFLGRLRSNFTGSEFVGYDAGINPKTLIDATSAGGVAAGRRPSETKIQNVRQELCTIIYGRCFHAALNSFTVLKPEHLTIHICSFSLTAFGVWYVFVTVLFLCVFADSRLSFCSSATLCCLSLHFIPDVTS
jgi:hypothetical protein